MNQKDLRSHPRFIEFFFLDPFVSRRPNEKKPAAPTAKSNAISVTAEFMEHRSNPAQARDTNIATLSDFCAVIALPMIIMDAGTDTI